MNASTPALDAVLQPAVRAARRRCRRRIGWSAVWLLLLALSPFVRAETEVADCTEEALRVAVDDAALSDGVVVFTENCAITLANPITINAEIGITIDAGTNAVTINGGPGVFVFDVQNQLTLAGLTIAKGQNTNGGGLYIESGATVVLTNCILAGNTALGTNGTAGANGADKTTSNAGNGGSGTAGTSALGGAIFNQGDLALYNCKLITNSATGGNGGAGGNGGNSVLYTGGNGGSGGPGAAAYGGAIYSIGALALWNCTLSNNTVTAGNGGSGGTNGNGVFTGWMGSGGAGGTSSGAGIFSTGGVVVANCTFSANVASGGDSAAGGGGNIGVKGAAGGSSFGAGLNSAGGAITNCTFSGNTAVGGTGGNGGPGNYQGGDGGNGGAATGGALYSTAGIAVVNCTVANCGATGGAGGSAGSGPFAGSSGGTGAALGGGIASGGGIFTLQNSILSTNSPGLNGSGTITDGGRNLSSDNTPTSLNATNRNKDPKIGVLANNGGPAMTIALLSTASPAYAQIPANAPGLPLTDERGIARPGVGKTAADIGAYEVAPPFLAALPQYVSPTNGGAATLSASVIGDPPLQYRWQLNGANILGATKSSYSLSIVTNGNAGPYRVVVTNGYGAATSPAVFVQFAPSVASQPTNQTAASGSRVTMAVTGAGDTSGLSYQWQLYRTNIAGGTTIGFLTNTFATYHTNVLVLNGAQPTDAGPYNVIITNAFGNVTSAVGTLVVQVQPHIVTQPASQTVAVGSNASFSVAATGTTLTYQWHFNGTDILGATQSTYTRINTQTNHAGSYTVTVANGLGTEDSFPPAILTVVTNPPAITAQPDSLVVVTQGQTAAFSVSASGELLSYQWTFNSANLPGATAASLAITNAQAASAGTYAVVVSNPIASIASSNSTLKVLVPPLITQVHFASGVFSFVFQSQSGLTYVIEYKDALTGTNGWAGLTTTNGTGLPITASYFTTNPPARFYRVRAQ